ncbi:aliphatic sulfonate ABC transporter substrate-binding protein [Clostridium cellulovorans]|uniref:Aliphatic sulfonates family ABC transporter, periplasmic ligand-binding protein n=1 Tax=Clostridium cellulovorans (strain ATCC 35296 / DSM 3052 / OCM 3 / 743B) TaxID=573061 RepID=D9SVW8_CLOC7|nr:aliphatic sulfonate ABC transporter substrate-binding protein [Clostridium cellulovorans]ADL53179.1 aliphatic sulfonates family ABC transporter, periplasmic ligand-binding protein [Clostridium cellulovorans 743B]
MKKNRLFSLIAILGITLINVTGCNSNEKIVTKDVSINKTADKVKIGFVDVTGTGQISSTLGLARDSGFVDEELKKVGAEAEFVPMTGAGPAINEALASKNLDIGNLGDVPAIIGKAAGIDTELISSAGLVNGASLIVPKNSTVTSVKDLKGKKIATQKGAFMHKVLIDILKSNGLKVEDIEFVNMNAQDSADALVSGNVDGAVIGGITLGKLVLNGQAKVIVDYRDNPQWNTASYTIVRTEFAKNNPDIVKAILKSLVRAKKLCDQDSTASLEQWKRAGNSEETYKYLYPKNDYVDEIEISSETINSGKSTIEFLKNNSLIKNDVDFNKWINKSYYEEVKNG